MRLEHDSRRGLVITMSRVLVIDDDEDTNAFLTTLAEQMGHEVTSALTCSDGLQASLAGSFDVVFLDVRLPDGNGLNMVRQIRATPSSPEIIIITGKGDPDGAELAIRNGAWDYIEKPADFSTLDLPLRRAIKYREGNREPSSPVALKLNGIIGNSPETRSCLELLAQAALSKANVLITGETGTGKELFAWALHDNSPRASKNFAVVDCAALPESLVESALFGHLKGAFTGADHAQDGLVKHADGGTLFLDEVGELSLRHQKAFLRVLQERRFRPLGSKQEQGSDFRLIAATNGVLEQMVKEGKFREDLLFRLQGFEIELPPLRNRRDDIRDLLAYHVSKICQRQDLEIKDISPELFEALEAYDWPGNVRELVNALERSVAVAGNLPVLFPAHLPHHIRIYLARSSVSQSTEAMEAPFSPLLPNQTSLPPLADFRSTCEKHYLQELIARTAGNLDQASAIARLSVPRLYQLLRKYHLKRQHRCA